MKKKFWSNTLVDHMLHGLCIKRCKDGVMCNKPGTHITGSASIGDRPKLPMKMCDKHYHWWLKMKGITTWAEAHGQT